MSRRPLDPLGEAKGLATLVLQQSRLTALQRGRLESRLNAHPEGLTAACEAEHARIVKAKLTPEGWIVSPPPPEKLAVVFATAALLAGKRPGLDAAIECQRLADQAFKLSHTPHVVRGAEATGRAAGKVEGIAVGEEQARRDEAGQRKARATAAAKAPRPKSYTDDELAEAYRSAKKQLGGSRRGIVKATHAILGERLQLSDRSCPTDGQVGRALKKAGLI